MSPGRRVAGILCVLSCMALPTPGQDLAEERDRVLTVIGTVKDVDLPLHPLQPEVGLAFVQDLHEPESYEQVLGLLDRHWMEILRDPCSRTNSALVRPASKTFFMEHAFQ